MSQKTFGFKDAVALECTSCHDPHDRNGTLPAPDAERSLCTSCHDEGSYGFGGGHADLPCTGCHSVHGGYQVELLAAPSSDGVCASCHEQDGVSGAVDAAVSAVSQRARLYISIALPTAPKGHAEPPEGSCIECHAPHGPPRY